MHSCYNQITLLGATGTSDVASQLFDVFFFFFFCCFGDFELPTSSIAVHVWAWKRWPTTIPWRLDWEEQERWHPDIDLSETHLYWSVHYMGLVLCNQVQGQLGQESGSACTPHLLWLKAWRRTFNTEVSIQQEWVSAWLTLASSSAKIWD